MKALALLAVFLMVLSFWALLLKGGGLKWGAAFALAVVAVLFLVAILGAARQREDGRTSFSRDGFGGWR